MLRSRAVQVRPTSLLYFVAPAAGIAFGMIAVLLGGVVPPTPPSGGFTTTPIVFTNKELALLSGVLLAGLAFVFIAHRTRGGTIATGPLLLVAVGIILAVLILLVLLVFVSTPAPPQSGSAPAAPSNGTTGSPVYPVWKSAPLTVLPPSWPPWVPYALLLVVLFAGAILAGPLLQAFLSRGGRAATRPTPSAPSKEALERALAELTDPSGRDPRTVIIALYGQLLAQVGERAGRLEPRTPREIEERIVEDLGIRRASAQVLTGLFEEARYSTLPLSEGNVDRARSSLEDALSSLAPAASA